ncbi:hypothetical protein [Erythrobacter sp. R86502]|uniref:hypothetical protein n=1 Tax=Erythrobacter sp. R86502 TaxID=3093846 RepID=UPI0036D28FE0
MLTDSERFAFVPYRIHVFETSGNAYDAVQTDDRIATGDLLLVMDEAIVGVAMTWPFAVTAEAGHLHQVAPKPGHGFDQLAASLGVEPAAMSRATSLARQLGFTIEPALQSLMAP